jgi:hypothetical protein
MMMIRWVRGVHWVFVAGMGQEAAVSRMPEALYATLLLQEERSDRL